jgi:PKD repeat protein
MMHKLRDTILLLVTSLVLSVASVGALWGLSSPRSAAQAPDNLSGTANLTSAYPDIATGGDWTGVVWVEGEVVKGHPQGNAYLRASSDAGQTWGGKITVFERVGAPYAYDIDVAIDGDTAHLAYIVFEGNVGRPDRSWVYYRTCSLTTGDCNGSESLDLASEEKVTWADIAVDADGNPHVVWVRYDASGTNGEIWYSSVSGENKDLFLPGKVSEVDDSFAPSIACASGNVHVTWRSRYEVSGEVTHYIYYSRRSDGPSWYREPLDESEGFKLGNPKVAAQNQSVVIVWDWYVDNENNRSNVVYMRNDDAGESESWPADAYEVGTGKQVVDKPRPVYDTRSRVGEYKYVSDLRPVVALNGDGWPAVVWHADRSGNEDLEYALHHSCSVNGTDDNVDWITPTVMHQSQPATPGAGSPTVALSQSGGTWYLHTAYMRKQSTESEWDVYYERMSYTPSAQIETGSPPPDGQLDGEWIVEPGDDVGLDGSGSTSEGNLDLEYDWSLSDQPTGSASWSSTEEAPTFTPDKEGRYTVKLVVDNGLATAQETQRILASETGDMSPRAKIEVADYTPQVGHDPGLDGSGSIGGGDPSLKYNWWLSGRPAGSQRWSESGATPAFTPDKQGWYTVTLEVTNEEASDRDTQLIYAWTESDPGYTFPKAQIDARSLVSLEGASSAIVPLDGSDSSSNMEDSSLEYRWWLSPESAYASLSSSDGVSTALTLSKVGWYTVTLEVENTDGMTDRDTHQILANIETYRVYLPLTVRQYRGGDD